MRKFLIFASVVLAVLAGPVLAQHLNNPDVGIGENGAISQPGKSLGVVRAHNLRGELEIIKVQLPMALVTVVRNGNKILAAQYDTTFTAKEKPYYGFSRTTDTDLVITPIPGGDPGFTLYDVTNATTGEHLFFILWNNVNNTYQIIP